MGFREVALVGVRVAPRARQLGAPLFEARSTTLGTRLIDECRCTLERCADLARCIRFRRAFSQQDAGQDELRGALVQRRAAVILTRNYGEAAAIDYFGPALAVR